MNGDFGRFHQLLAFFAVLLTIVLLNPHSGFSVETRSGVHGPVCAGTWYPADPSQLKTLIESYLGRVPDAGVNGKIAAIISPHAGIMYSGQVAAYSYKLLKGQKFDTVIVIAPSHHVPFRGAAVLDREGFATPLGTMTVNRGLVAELRKKDSGIMELPEAFSREHSLEMQLPFLQTVLPGAKLVPLILGDNDLSSSRRLGESIAECIKGKSVLIVASSDLSHFHGYETANEMDRRLLDKVSSLDAEGLNECLGRGECEACGRAPILTAIFAVRKLGAGECKVLHYENSGDVTGDKNSPRGVVGYSAAAFFRASDRDSMEPAPKRKAGIDLGLSEQEKAELHLIARKTIEAKCRGSANPEITTASARLKENYAAFVSLYKKGELRGCIGHIVARKPLAETVAEMAEAAALRDPRFSPVRPDELGDIRIEISVMTPLQKVKSPEEIEVGKHGLVVQRRNNIGLLLPQVATEQGWDRTTFLENTCLKAGLPRNAWKEAETEIYLFSADVF